MRKALCAMVAALVMLGLIMACANIVGVDRYYEECRKDASISPQNATCLACLGANCRVQISACLCDPQCLMALDCFNACDSGSGCACAQQFSSDKTSQLSQCVSGCPTCVPPADARE